MDRDVIDVCLRLNGMSEEEIDSAFARLRSTAAGSATHELIEAEVMKISALSPVWTIRSGVGGGRFYRVRKHDADDLPQNLGALGYIRDARKAGLGRANRKCSPVMYLAGQAMTAMFETRLLPGQHFTLTQYEMQESKLTLNLMHLGLQGMDSSNLSLKDAAVTPAAFALAGLNATGFENIRRVQSRLGDIFTNPDERIYPVSSELAQVYYRTDFTDGLLYPSMRHDGVLNFAILPRAADAKLVATQAWGFVALDVSDGPEIKDRYVTFQHLRTAPLLGAKAIGWADASASNRPHWI